MDPLRHRMRDIFTRSLFELPPARVMSQSLIILYKARVPFLLSRSSLSLSSSSSSSLPPYSRPPQYWNHKRPPSSGHKRSKHVACSSRLLLSPHRIHHCIPLVKYTRTCPYRQSARINPLYAALGSWLRFSTSARHQPQVLISVLVEAFSSHHSSLVSCPRIPLMLPQ